MSTSATGWRRVLIQVVLSGIVLYLVLHDTDLERLGTAIKSGSLAWLALAISIKTSALLVHEYRLWLALPTPRPPVRSVISLGLAAGVLNLALPARAGDLAAIAFLDRECDVPPNVGTTAVAVTSFLEAALFGFFLLGVLTVGGAHWAELFGEDVRQTAVYWIAGSVGLGCVGLGVLSVVARRWAPGQGPQSRVLRFVYDTIAETARVLRDARYLGVQIAAAAIQVTLVVVAFSIALPASGATVSDPIMAASIVLGMSSLAAFVLPPTMAAGPAAASALVLPLFGVTPEGALAYAGTYWLVAHLPAMTMGLPSLWARRFSSMRESG